jgi:hypothetical protein
VVPEELCDWNRRDDEEDVLSTTSSGSNQIPSDTICKCKSLNIVLGSKKKTYFKHNELVIQSLSLFLFEDVCFGMTRTDNVSSGTYYKK